MSRRTSGITVVSILVLVFALSGPILAQEEEKEVELGMSNSTELSYVLTEGNSNTDALGFKNRFRYSLAQLQIHLSCRGDADEHHRRPDCSGSR